MKKSWPQLLMTGALIAIGAVSYVTFGADTSGEWKAPDTAAKVKNPVPADNKSIAAGKTVYAQQCLACHGATGKGNGPAAKGLQKSVGDLTSAQAAQQSDGALFWKITQGRSPMPSFAKTLTEQQRWQVVNYIRSLQKQGGKSKS